MNTSKDELMRSISRRRDMRRSPATITCRNDCDTVDAYLARGGRVYVARHGESVYDFVGKYKAPLIEFEGDKIKNRVPDRKRLTIQSFKATIEKLHYEPKTVRLLKLCFVDGLSIDDVCGDPSKAGKARDACNRFWRKHVHGEDSRK